MAQCVDLLRATLDSCTLASSVLLRDDAACVTRSESEVVTLQFLCDELLLLKLI